MALNDEMFTLLDVQRMRTNLARITNADPDSLLQLANQRFGIVDLLTLTASFCRKHGITDHKVAENICRALVSADQLPKLDHSAQAFLADLYEELRRHQ